VGRMLYRNTSHAMTCSVFNYELRRVTCDLAKCNNAATRASATQQQRPSMTPATPPRDQQRALLHRPDLHHTHARCHGTCTHSRPTTESSNAASNNARRCSHCYAVERGRARHMLRGLTWWRVGGWGMHCVTAKHAYDGEEGGGGRARLAAWFASTWVH
jgi:hypothetical protein